MRAFAQISVFLALAAIFFSCEKPKMNYSDVPEIGFKSYDLTPGTGGSYSLHIVLSFTDGNGDIGLTEADSFPPFNSSGEYYNNIIGDYYELESGKFRHVGPGFRGDTTINGIVYYNGRVPVLTPAGKNKAIKGDLEYTFDVGPTATGGNTIKFKFWVYDRALHRSNTVESPEIVLN